MALVRVWCPWQEELEAAGLGTIVDRSKAADDIRKLAEADEKLPEAVVKAFEDAMRNSGRSMQGVFDALALPADAKTSTPGKMQPSGCCSGGCSYAAGAVEVHVVLPGVIEAMVAKSEIGRGNEVHGHLEQIT